uniref:Replication-associated protein G2P N-terminal domain-containing protein n=1 Tax=Aliivibrio wodanis TaxID=80852 RepID=A0A5Q4ZYC6_9GAMM|nr:hypothetical protein AW0309160_04362 [Aliivibrio wodanis]
MCSSLFLSHPDLMDMLQLENAETMQLDCTFFARVDSEIKAKQVISHMANVSHGQVRASKVNMKLLVIIIKLSSLEW